MTLSARKQQLLEDFELLENWEEKYDYLIELGMDLPEMPPELKTDLNLVRGCQSSVWFDIRCEDHKIIFDADSDSLIVKGIVAVVNQLFNEQPAEDVLKADLSFFEEVGLWQHLSAQRGNGLLAMIAHLKKASTDCLSD
jgi:cysteine desulfuration protein SufE